MPLRQLKYEGVSRMLISAYSLIKKYPFRTLDFFFMRNEPVDRVDRQGKSRARQNKHITKINEL